MKEYKSSRILDNLPEQFFASLVKKAQQKQTEGYDVINLGQGSPDLPTPEHIVKAMQEAVSNPAYHRYSPFKGFPFLKEAIATYYEREFNVKIDPTTEVAILFGAKTGLVEVSQCMLDAEDLALVPDPGYPDYLSGIHLAQAEVSKMPLRKENAFLPNYREIAEEDLDRAKLMFLNYPNNPTASVANKDFFDETVKLANDHDICVVHDFAYSALHFDGKKAQSFLQSEGAKDIGIEIYTMSKTYNMAGWRVGFALGNQSVIKKIETLQDHLYVSLFGAVQEAAAKALLLDQAPVKEMLHIYEKRREAFVHALEEIGYKIDPPAGSFFVWMPVPKGYTSTSFSELLLEEAHVVVAPGNGFGEYGEGYVRIGLLDKEERLIEAVARMEKLNVF